MSPARRGCSRRILCVDDADWLNTFLLSLFYSVLHAVGYISPTRTIRYYAKQAFYAICPVRTTCRTTINERVIISVMLWLSVTKNNDLRR